MRLDQSTLGHSNAALRGVPSLVWRAGQARRLSLILNASSDTVLEKVLVNGCGVGLYLDHLTPHAKTVIGLDIELDRLKAARFKTPNVVCAAGEALPFDQATFDLILSHEVIEHVTDDQTSIEQMVYTLHPGGRIVLFCPNKGYPFETHGIYLGKKYYFGNFPLINYLPGTIRDKLAPHVRAYSRKTLYLLFTGLPVKITKQKILFGGYDNIIARFPQFGRLLRWILQVMEKTPLQIFGLSHFWVIEKTQ